MASPTYSPPRSPGLADRGVLIAPFHNMMLVSPATTDAQVGRLASTLDDCLGKLTK